MICMQLFQNLTKKMQNPRYSSNGSSAYAILLFPLRPGLSGISILPHITDAPVTGGPYVGTIMWGTLGCSSGTCRDTRTDQCAFSSCLYVSPEAKPHDSSLARQLQATDIAQVSWKGSGYGGSLGELLLWEPLGEDN